MGYAHYKYGHAMGVHGELLVDVVEMLPTFNNC